MAQNTEHYNLVKPDYTDPADVSQLNDNMDTIDGILWQLANAGADDELLAKVQEILDKIGETDDTGGSTVAGTVMAKLNNIQANTDGLDDNLAYLNSTIDSENPVALDILMTQLLYGTVFEYSSPGTYSLLIPANVSKIRVTACGGGGGGAAKLLGSGESCGGGGGGAAIVNQEYDVVPQSTLSITIGKGGAAATGYPNTQDFIGGTGESTIIDSFVTLPGGHGGQCANIENGVGGGGIAGGAGGGAGGNGYVVTNSSTHSAGTGTNGISGTGGAGGIYPALHYYSNRQPTLGGGGGGSLGNGGAGQSIAQTMSQIRYAPSGGSAGSRGGGGGGGATVTGASIGNGFAGGNGYAKIELIITP